MADTAENWADAYDRKADKIIADLDEFITENFGARCDTFDEDCPTCELWRSRDRIREIVVFD